MKRLLIPALALLLFLRFQEPGLCAPMTYRFSPQKGIQFFSKAPVEDFDGTASDLNGSMDLDPTRPSLGLTASISVPVKSMETGLAMRDQHMRSAEWLNEARFPTIKFQLASPREQKVKKLGDSRWFVNAIGEFTIKNTTRNISVPVTIEKKGEAMVVSGSFKVHLSDYGIHGPMAMNLIGMKVSPDVQVTFKLTGTPEKPWK